MTPQQDVPQHIKTTETFVRLYVLLSQHLDRCHDEGAKSAYPESEFQMHLTRTRTEAAQLSSNNRVVKDKVEDEYENILNLGAAYVKDPNDERTKDQLLQERAVLRIKMLTLSDLLAVFRSSD
ncbi:MAG: hypothetical protein GKS05_04775 [Nitrospirales bacterium]|nr:hypothetical protein [Nitrospirales bacterium]